VISAGHPAVGLLELDCEVLLTPEHGQRLILHTASPGGEPAQRHRGHRLGLPLSKRLAEAMGGTLELVSTPQQGSTFWIELPMVEAPVQQVERQLQDAPAPGTAEAAPPGPDRPCSTSRTTCPTSSWWSGSSATGRGSG
jgi:hypothetical protein